jgi:hypothetical protein
VPAGFTARKFNGDDQYSWAVFRKGDLPRGHRGIVFFGQAKPVVSGMSRNEARFTVRDLESKR